MVNVFGLVGENIGYSQSPNIFQSIFEQEDIPATYQLFDIDTIEKIDSVFANAPLGLNVTQPYKEAIIPFLDRLDQTAKAVGAVNTIAFEDGEKVGYNTDVMGFWQAIESYLPRETTQALVLGSGGAAKAAQHALETKGIVVQLVSRQPEKGQLAYSDLLPETIAQFQVIINATPLGSAKFPETFPSIPYTGIQPEQLAFDMVYSPQITPFMEKAQHQGATAVNGRSMLQFQAEAAWDIWKKLNFS